MKRMSKAFTLTEILIVIIIIGILASLTIPRFIKTAQMFRDRQCELNLKLLHIAVKLYTYDHDAVPGTLGEVWPEYRDRAIAQLLLEGEDFGRQEGFISRLVSRFLARSAEAQPLRFYGVDMNVLTCPCDRTPPPDGVSYGINSMVAGEPASALKDLPEGALLIADCDAPTLTSEAGVSARHRIGLFAGKHGNLITKGNEIKKTPGYPIKKTPGYPIKKTPGYQPPWTPGPPYKP